MRAVVLAVAFACAVPASAGAAGLPDLPYLNCYDNSDPGCTNPFHTNNGVRADTSAISADGKHLYVAGAHAVYHYTRDVVTGTVTLHDCIDEGGADTADCAAHLPGSQITMITAAAIALSPDQQQKDIYVSATGDGNTGRTIIHLRRDPATGALTFGECIAEQAGTTCTAAFGTHVDARSSMSGLTISPDGSSVLATSAGFTGAELLNLDRVAATGALSLRQCFTFSNTPNQSCTDLKPPNTPAAPASCSTDPINLTGVAVPSGGTDVYASTSQCALGAVVHLTRAADGSLTYQSCIGFSNPGSCAGGSLSGDAQGAEDSIATSPDGQVYVGVGDSGGSASAGLVHLRRAPNGDLSFGDCISAAGVGCTSWLSGAPGGNSPLFVTGLSSDGQSFYATTTGYNSGVNNVDINGGVLHFKRDTSATASHGAIVALTSCFAADNAQQTYPACTHPPASTNSNAGRTGGRGATLTPDDNQLYEPTGAGGWGGLIQLGVFHNFTVNSTSDTVDAGGCTTNPICSLRDAVIAANAAGGSNTITVPTGTYSLTIAPSGNDDVTTGDLNITDSITITGAGAGATTIDGGGSASAVTDRVFRVESTGSLTLSAATIRHGHPAGGAGLGSEGGGILALGPLTLTDVNVVSNFVETPGDRFSGAGAGISQEASVPISLTRVTVSDNQVTVTSGVVGGGGGLMLEGGSPGSVTIADSVISGNTAAGPGGGIYSNPSANVGDITITRTTIGGNHAALPPNLSTSSKHAFGGGIATAGAISVTLTRDFLVGNTADQAGGGILDDGGSNYTITDSTITGNVAAAGFTAGSGDFLGGGGIAADGGSTTPGWKLSGDIIYGNQAGSKAAGIPGGGIDEDGGDAFTIVNTTIFSNSASGIGGGYESSGGGTHHLTNVTLDRNSAGSGSGGNIDNSSGGIASAFSLANTIVSRGLPANCGTENASPLPASLGHNLDTGTTCAFNRAGDLTNRNDPGLAFPADNGGPTVTEALTGGSPAIDAGDNALCPPFDQRGVPRPQNGVCDIGAYELLHSTTVTNTNDSGAGSLRDAIGLSGPGTTIDFAPALNGQTITLTGGALTIPTGLTIAGPGAGNLTIDGNHSDQVFDVEAASTDTVSISGLTVTGGQASGSGVAGGGGIFAGAVGQLNLTDLTVTGNQVSASSALSLGGGGVYVDGGDVTVTNSRIFANKATLTGAKAASGGGGLYSNGGTVTVNGSVVTGNTVDQSASSSSNGSDGGGGIYSDGGLVTVTNSMVSNNSDNVDLSSNGSSGGGGIHSDGGKVVLTGDQINGNTFTVGTTARGDNGGGGVYSEGGNVTVTSSSIDSNTAKVDNDTSTDGRDGGGGLYSEGGNIQVTASSMSENTAQVTATTGGNGGGAVFDEGGHATYLNSTLSDNSLTVSGPAANEGGGAIHTDGGSGAVDSLIDVTAADNSSNQPGGALLARGGTFKLKNTILAANSATPAGNCAATASGQFASAGFNLEDGNSCGLASTGDLSNTDPKLGPLQNNGGPTRTRALASNSPAVDAGACTDMTGDPVTADQRGTSRPQPAGGKCDIGAFELASAAPATPPSVSGISPSSGPAAGGTSVTVTGRGFSGATAVRFGGTSAASFHVDSDTQVTAGAPAGSGTVDVTVTTPAGTSATGAGDRFTYQAGAPGVTQTAAGPSSSTGAVFSGSVNPNGKSTTVHWEYGLDPAYRPPGFTGNIFDQSTPPQTLPPGNSPVPVQASATNLVPNAVYHVRLAADNGSGPVFGPDQTFTTPKGPPPPPPKLGTENVTPTGSVFQLVNGKLVPLTQPQSLRSGTVVDALHGTVNLIAATGNKGQKFIGAFSGAVFKITQTLGGRDKGLTTLALVEGAFPGDPTYASCKVRAAGPFGQAALSRRILQTLRASASGRFRTRGRYAAATVRGTKWTTADRCDGTLVAVQLHSVLVNDFVKRINVVVTAGHSYLAKAPKHK